jgi:hypothetical protein
MTDTALSFQSSCIISKCSVQHISEFSVFQYIDSSREDAYFYQYQATARGIATADVPPPLRPLSIPPRETAAIPPTVFADLPAGVTSEWGRREVERRLRVCN